MSAISSRLLPWFEQYGRKDLPWQQQATPYKVWLSEIMLQQTQVAAVIPYYLRFLQTFPQLQQLAEASLDQVLQHWAGLGYYARARNLHKTAQIVARDYRAEFPSTLEQLMALPGIGRSTAGAILSLGFGQRAVILDGNVKRVLARVYQVPGWSGQSATQKQLWQLAEQQTPLDQTAFYNQAMMDLGSMVCKRSRPECVSCPLRTQCLSFRDDTQALFPQSKPRSRRPQRQRWFLLHTDDAGRLLLQRRPPQGVWGGLWSLPEIERLEDLSDWQLQQAGKSAVVECVSEQLLIHQFSHFDLAISLAEISVSSDFVDAFSLRVSENTDYKWISWEQLTEYGLPAPVERILSWVKQHPLKDQRDDWRAK